MCLIAVGVARVDAAERASTNGRPNVLLIVAEDMNGRVGAFGDEVAKTPSLDALARQGIRFPNVFTVSGVCAPSRSALMTGVHAIAMGTHQMRTSQGVPGSAVQSYEAVPPADVKAFPELLRAAGYATANFAKKDYQFGEPFTLWDVDAGGFTSPLDPALWRQLPEDKPFFVMINLMSTHESRLAPPGGKFEGPWAAMMETLSKERAKAVTRVTDPASVTVPPYLPNTESVRASIAQHYDNIHFMDGQVRQILDALEQDGLADDTIVIWTADNGDGFPRAKRAVYDSGIKVPMIVRFPDGHGSGSVRDQLVSFVDVAPTVLKLAGADVPGFIQGQDFLRGQPRQYVLAARDRMDDVSDRVRALRDSRYKYIRNLQAEVPYFRPLLFRDMFPAMQALWSGLQADGLTATQRFYFTAPRPAEELYDTQADPHEIDNLAGDPEHREILVRMRAELDRRLEEVGDRGGEPEIEMLQTMWPQLEQPVTVAPKATIDFDAQGARQVTLSSTTSGASIGYRWVNGDSADRWQLYTSPLHWPAGSRLEARAIRYGYAESPVTRIGGVPVAAAADRVRLTDGVLEGVGAQADGMRVFLGIPFAQPPVGALRWRPPQEVTRWQGIRKADAFGPHCMQDLVYPDIEFRSQAMSEDCLYLNVWTTAASASERRPVLVYIHGGGFIAGDGSESRYDGASMARQGIVFVTLNYRLGVFGFLAHPELSREAAYGGSGNYGLLDQAAALRWVRRNITAFGGDPERITIAGESAGSISVSAQMASPLSRDLIAGAIGESGSIVGSLSAVPLARAEAAGRDLVAKTGVTSLSELRAMPAARLMQATRTRTPRLPPTIDGYFLPTDPREIYRKGEHARAPLLAGSNSQEMTHLAVLGPEPATREGYRRAVTKLYGKRAEAIMRAYPVTLDEESVLDAAQQLAGDRFIAHSTWKWMQLVTDGGERPTFYYLYSRKRPPFTPQAAARIEPALRQLGFPILPPRGAVHAAEIEYALGNLDQHAIYQWSAEDYEVSRVMQAYWVNFVKQGDPNGPQLPRWPHYASGQRMIIDVQPGAELDREAERRRAVDGVLLAEQP